MSTPNRLLLVLAAGLAPVSAALAQTYVVQELSPLAGDVASYAMGINDAGIAVGQSANGPAAPAAMWIGGVPQSLGIVPGFSASLARSVNNHNQVAGQSYNNRNLDQGVPFVWEAGVLTALPLALGFGYGVAFQINDNGVVAGGMWQSPGSLTRVACTWQHGPGGAWTVAVLPTLGGHYSLWANGLNNAGVVVGLSASPPFDTLHACWWFGETVSMLHLPIPAEDVSAGGGINSDGVIVGGFIPSGGASHGFLFDGGTMTETGFLPGYSNIAVWRINAAGTAVGHAFNGDPHDVWSSDTESAGIVWRNGHLWGLNNLVEDTSYDIRQAWDINASGQIACFTQHNGSIRGAILTPRCGSADFNCDGDVGTDADLEAFFDCLSGACPPAPCTSTADFNFDGDVGTDSDLEAFFRVLAGGHC